MASFVKKLIWQPATPLPFESGWSLFAKLLILNQMKPHQLANLIRTTDLGDVNKLRFRSSDWINLTLFAEMLSINPNRLRVCFFDQMQIYTEESYSQLKGDGIKICPECVAKGYHCLFFELSFIDTCPWHNVALEQACPDCLRAVYSKGLQFNPLKNHHEHGVQKIRTEALGEWKSTCNHLVFEVDIVRKLNLMNHDEQQEINRKCRLLYGWIKTAQTRLDLTEKLFCFTHVEANKFDKFFNAAEKIAGKCPWPINLKRTQVKWITFNSNQDHRRGENHNQDSIVTLNEVYGSIRRHIFNRYVRHHRTCHNSIMNLKRDDSLSLDTDRVCGLALAYSVWRLKIENFINIEALKYVLGKKREFLVNDFCHPNIHMSIEMQANLIYMQFFYFWELIDQNIGKNSMVINSSGLPFLINNMCSAYSREMWSGIYPQPEPLLNNAFIRCVQINKKSKSLTNDRITRSLAYGYHANQMSDKLGIMFKLTKFQSAPNIHSLVYINL
jgi:hypothetical protein